MERVRCITKDEINLIGFRYGTNLEEWNIIIPGVDGNIFTNEFISYMGEYFCEHGQTFLFAHHRGSFQIISSNSLNSKVSGKTIGSAFEKFDDSFYDVDAWVKFAVDNGAKKINLLGHSHGCNKLINYLSKVSNYDNYINKIILISPLDLRTRMNKRRELADLYYRADEIKKKDSKGNFVCCGFFYKDSDSFYDMMENPAIDNFPMMNVENNNFDIFNSIRKDKYIVYGSDETKYTLLYNIKSNFFNEYVKSLDVIEGANHIYQGKETEISKYVLDIVKENTFMNKMFLNAGIRITRKCNMNCMYCNIQSEKKSELTLDEWKKAGNIIKKLGIKDLVILGGEPTEYEQLPALVSYYEKQLDIRCSVTTNAYNNYFELERLVDAGISQLGVSVDNLNFKNSISPLKCKNGLEILSKLKSLNGNLKIVDYLVLNKKNCYEISDIIRYMSENGVYTYILPFHHSNQNEFEHRKNDMPFAFVTDDEIKEFEDSIDIIKNMKNQGFLISNSNEFFDIAKKHIRRLDWKCNELSELRIDSDGMLACCCDKLGEVNRNFSIFDLEDEKKLLQFIKMRLEDSKNCSGCLWPSSVEAELRKKLSK